MNIVYCRQIISIVKDYSRRITICSIPIKLDSRWTPVALRSGARRPRGGHRDVLRCTSLRRWWPLPNARCVPVGAPRRVSRGVAIGLVYVAISGDLGGRRDAAAHPVAPDQRGRVAGARLRAVAAHVAGGLDTVLRAGEAPGGTSAAHRRVTARRRRSRRHPGARIGGRRHRHPLVPALDRADPRAGVLHAQGCREPAAGRAQRAAAALSRGYWLFEELNTTLAASGRSSWRASWPAQHAGWQFAVLGLPYAVLLGVLAAVLEFVPLVGPLAMAVIAGIIASLHAPMLAVWVTRSSPSSEWFRTTWSIRASSVAASACTRWRSSSPCLPASNWEESPGSSWRFRSSRSFQWPGATGSDGWNERPESPRV